MLSFGTKQRVFGLKNLLNRGDFWPGILVVVLFFALFSPSLPYSFINFDDNVYLYENPLVTDFDLSKVKDIFSSDHTSLFSPLVVLSYALEYQIWGPNPLFFRLINFLLHAGSILLLYTLCLRLFGGRGRAFIVSLLFAVHPLRIESVVWVTERKDALFVFFVLLTLLLYLKYLREKSNRPYILALFTLSIAMLAKVSAFSALPLMWLLDWWEGRPFDRASIRDKIPFALVILLLGITGMGFLSTSKYGISQGLGRMGLSALGIMGFLVTRFLWPFQLAIRYPLLIEELLRPYWVHVLLALVFILLTGWLSRWSRSWIFGGCFTLLASIPVLGVMWRMYPMADRYSYLPAVGLGLMVWETLSSLAQRWRDDRRGQMVKWAGVSYLLAVMLWGTLSYLPVWRDSMSLWNHQLSLYPESELAYNNRSLLFKEQGLYERALADLDRAIDLYPDFVEAYWNRGLCYDLMKRPNDSDINFFHAMFREPARFEQFVALAGKGLFEKGLERASQLGEELERQGRRSDVSFYYHMSFLYAELNRWEEAERYIEKALRLEDNPLIRQLQERVEARR